MTQWQKGNGTSDELTTRLVGFEVQFILHFACDRKVNGNKEEKEKRQDPGARRSHDGLIKGPKKKEKEKKTLRGR